MDALYAGAIQQDPNVERAGLDYLSLPWGDALAASMKDTWFHSPSMQLPEESALQYARHPESRQFFDAMASGQNDLIGADIGALRDRLAGNTGQQVDNGADAYVDPHTLNQKYGKSIGLSFDKPERKGAVDIMVARRQRDIDLNARLDHAPDGLTYQGVRLLTSLAVGAADPLNVASAFVPVVGSTRAGLWAARYGKFGSRALTGAIEGGVGQALLEPLNAATEISYGNHYGPMDAFMNVAFGTILGGGLHTGFGFISDLMGRVSPETREQTLRTAVAQMAEGRDVQVDQIIAADPNVQPLPPRQDLLVARQMKDGTVRYGERGQLHSDLAISDRDYENTPDSHMGFATEKGAPFMSRQESFDWVKKNQPGREAAQHLEAALEANQYHQSAEINRLLNFQTAKGSTYQAHGDGTTTRNKAARPDVGHEGQSGPQPRSQRTFYVTKEQADELSLFQTHGGGKMAVAETSDGRIGVKYLDGKDAGKFEKRTVAAPMKEPAPGLIPVEVWNDGTRVHFGNEIVGVNRTPGATVLGSPLPETDVRDAIDRARSNTLDSARGQKPSSAASPEASKAAAETVQLGQGDDLAAELQEANARLAQYEKQGLLTPEELEAAKAPEVTEALSNRSKAADAAAICLNLHP